MPALQMEDRNMARLLPRTTYQAPPMVAFSASFTCMLPVE